MKSRLIALNLISKCVNITVGYNVENDFMVDILMSPANLNK